jgi:hypothetical protein
MRSKSVRLSGGAAVLVLTALATLGCGSSNSASSGNDAGVDATGTASTADGGTDGSASNPGTEAGADGSRSDSGGLPWSGIIDPSRAVDWRQAGIPGGLPDSNWTACGTTIAPYSGTADKINAQLATCSPNQYVLLGAGTFTLSTLVVFPTSGHIALRGSGADQTFLKFTATGGTGCFSIAGFISICGSDESYVEQPTVVYDWTAGYAQGTTHVTLSSVANITANATILVLNQCNTGMSGTPCTGNESDNGQFFVCAKKYDGTYGCSVDGPDGTTYDGTNRFQNEMFLVTAINEGGCGANCVTISPGVRAPNFTATQSPQAWFIQPIVQAGVEDLSIDGTGDTAINTAVMLYNCYECFVSGVRTTNLYTYSIDTEGVFHNLYQNNYFFNEPSTDPYGIRFSMSADNLVQNNIIEQVRSPIVFDNPDTGSVIAYNFFINDDYAGDAMFGAEWRHSTGDAMQLSEGNFDTGVVLDDDHGSHQMVTMFRNRYTGWESCGNGQCGTETAKDYAANAVDVKSYNRYMNVIGNVLGTEGFHTTYQGSDGGDLEVYSIGTGNGAVTPAIPIDPIAGTTLFRWGNYDVATGAARWCGDSASPGWATTCGSVSEVPSGISLYANPVPSSTALPASLYLSSKPAWWGSTAWPGVGPDVTEGNIGHCSGTLNTAGTFAGVDCTSDAQCRGTADPTATCQTALGGHASANPAMTCYLGMMGGAPDGTGGALTFNAHACYGGAP